MVSKKFWETLRARSLQYGRDSPPPLEICSYPHVLPYQFSSL